VPSFPWCHVSVEPTSVKQQQLVSSRDSPVQLDLMALLKAWTILRPDLAARHEGSVDNHDAGLTHPCCQHDHASPDDGTRLIFCTLHDHNNEAKNARSPRRWAPGLLQHGCGLPSHQERIPAGIFSVRSSDRVSLACAAKSLHVPAALAMSFKDRFSQTCLCHHLIKGHSCRTPPTEDHTAISDE